MNEQQEREAFEAWVRRGWDLYATDDPFDLHGRMWHAWQARAALAAKVPAGYKLVPVEPTEEMLQEVHMQVESHSFNNEFLYEVWDAMLAATPAPAPEASIARLVLRDDGRADLEWRSAALAANEKQPSRATDIATALALPGCERLKEWAEIGPVQRAAVEEFAYAMAAKVPTMLQGEDPRIEPVRNVVERLCGTRQSAENFARRILAAADSVATPAPAPEADKKNEWRELALKFDGQRMAALSHLRMLLEHGEAHADAVRKFLAEPPQAAPATAAKPEYFGDGPLVDGWELSISKGRSGYGVYAHMTDYPDEGAVFLLGLKLPAAAPAAAPADAKPEAQPLTAMRARSVVDGMGWALDEVEIEDMEMLVKAAERACAEAWGVKLIGASGEKS